MTISIDVFAGWSKDAAPPVLIETRYLDSAVHTTYRFEDSDGFEFRVFYYDMSREARRACDDMHYTWGVAR